MKKKNVASMAMAAMMAAGALPNECVGSTRSES